VLPSVGDKLSRGVVLSQSTFYLVIISNYYTDYSAIKTNAVSDLTSQISSFSLVEISLPQCTPNGRTV